MRETTADTKVSEEGGRGDSQNVGADSFPLQLVMKTVVRQVVPSAAHGGPRWSRYPSTCSPWKGPHAGAGGCLKEAVTPWGVCAGAGSWQDLQTPGERSPCQSRYSGRACDPVGDPHWSSLFLKGCTLWEGRWGSL